MSPRRGSDRPTSAHGPTTVLPARRVWGLALLALIVATTVAGLVWMTLGGGAYSIAGKVQGVGGFVADNRLLSVAVFGVGVFLIQLVSLPGGTIAVLTGGFLFGAPLAAGVYYLAQLAAAPVVFAAVRLGLGRDADVVLNGLARRGLPPRLAGIMLRAREESVLAIAVFRLAPVLTSTFVPALAAVLGLRLRALMLGSLLVSWIKPSITASIGAAGRTLSEVGDPQQMLAHVGAGPLLLAFAGAVGLLMVRVMLAQRN